MSKVVGLFGSCGKSTWRDAFITALEAAGIEYFNPNLPGGEWERQTEASKRGECKDPAQNEADHKANDDVIVMPCLGETYGSATLAEIGMTAAMLNSTDTDRKLVVYVEDETKMDESLKDNAQCFKESRNARRIVLAAIDQIASDNVRVASSLEEALDITLELVGAKETA